MSAVVMTSQQGICRRLGNAGSGIPTDQLGNSLHLEIVIDSSTTCRQALT